MRPLSGYRVVDLTRILAGPFCTMQLADMGAEVIKIEHVKNGDDTRMWGPPFSEQGNQSAYFLGVNRNKKSIAVDLKHPSGVQLVKDLVKSSDVLVENFVPGRLNKMGLGYEDMAKVNDQLVYATISGFGSTGPRAEMPAYDVMISAVGGLMGITGPKGGPPCKVGVAITDVCAGLVTQNAVLGALLARYKTGKGQRVETSLLNTQVATLANIASNYLVAGKVTGPQGTAHPSIVPYQDFACSDQNIVVGALNDGQFVNLAKAMDMGHLSNDAKFATNPQRVAHRDELLPILEEVFKSKTGTEWIDILEQSGVPCAPINNMKQVFEDKQVIHNERVLQVEHPTVGMLKMVAPPATFHGTPLDRFDPPPLHGQHTDEVLRSVLNYDDGKLAALKAEKVVHQYQW